MKYQMQGEKLVVTGLRELGAGNAKQFRDRCTSAIGPELRCLEVDLSETVFLDSWGLGALLSLHKMMTRQDGIVRLRHPRPEIQQLLELTRIHQILEILPAGVAPQSTEWDWASMRREAGSNPALVRVPESETAAPGAG